MELIEKSISKVISTRYLHFQHISVNKLESGLRLNTDIHANKRLQHQNRKTNNDKMIID